MTVKLFDTLNSLIQLDYDAVLAYTRAIDGCDPEHDAVKKRLEAFRADHEQHILDLSAIIVQLEGEVTATGRDFKGVLIEGMTAAQSAMGTHGALLAMRANEELTNRRYAAALQEDFGDDVKAVIRKNREDERRHVEWIKGAIERRVWEERGEATA